jgi:hypothetical protein
MYCWIVSLVYVVTFILLDSFTCLCGHKCIVGSFHLSMWSRLCWKIVSTIFVVTSVLFDGFICLWGRNSIVGSFQVSLRPRLCWSIVSGVYVVRTVQFDCFTCVPMWSHLHSWLVSRVTTVYFMTTCFQTDFVYLHDNHVSLVTVKIE